MRVTVNDVSQPGGFAGIAGGFARGDRSFGQAIAAQQLFVEVLRKSARGLIANRPQRADKYAGLTSEKCAGETADAAKLVTGTAGLARVKYNHRSSAVGAFQARELFDCSSAQIRRQIIAGLDAALQHELRVGYVFMLCDAVPCEMKQIERPAFFQ